jgi:hypothetical protein
VVDFVGREDIFDAIGGVSGRSRDAKISFLSSAWRAIVPAEWFRVKGAIGDVLIPGGER